MTRTTFKKALEAYKNYFQKTDMLATTFQVDLAESVFDTTVIELFDLVFANEDDWIKDIATDFINEHYYDLHTFSWLETPNPMNIYDGETIIKTIKSIDDLYDYCYEDNKSESGND